MALNLILTLKLTKTDDLAVYISLLFTALLVHGTAPSEFATSTVTPIPKGKRLNPTDSANYIELDLRQTV